jgi:hypothetical protein
VRMADRAARRPMPTTLSKTELDVLASKQEYAEYQAWKKRLEDTAATAERRKVCAELAAAGKRPPRGFRVPSAKARPRSPSPEAGVVDDVEADPELSPPRLLTPSLRERMFEMAAAMQAKRREEPPVAQIKLW